MSDLSLSGLDALHPVVQHHLVNTLQWSALRPLQAAVQPLLDGVDCLLLAPTAGGKTEAAVFPLLSRMAREGWAGTLVLYVCPLRALLNNLHPRLAEYAAWIGRSAALWHGAVSATERRRILRDQPDVLLTTPESLEAMLVSTKVDPRHTFAHLAAPVDGPTPARNCLFLCLEPDDVLHAAGLLLRWSQGWVEPVVPPPSPRHIVAQQLLARKRPWPVASPITDQHNGCSRKTGPSSTARRAGLPTAAQACSSRAPPTPSPPLDERNFIGAAPLNVGGSSCRRRVVGRLLVGLGCAGRGLVRGSGISLVGHCAGRA